MKVLISADIEGCAGVSSIDALSPGGSDWANACRWMTAEIVAATKAAHEGGAEEVIISDGHGNAQNILLDELPEYARLVRSWPRPLLQMQGVELEGVSACIFIGYHASTIYNRGVLAHTFKGSEFADIRLNGVSASEGYANAALAGDYGVPVIMMSGNEDAVEELTAYLPVIETAIVKQSYGFQSAITLTPAKSCALIAEKVTAAMARWKEIKPLKVEGPVTLEIDFRRRLSAEVFDYLPIISREGPYTVKYTASNMSEVMKFLTFILFSNPSGQIR